MAGLKDRWLQTRRQNRPHGLAVEDRAATPPGSGIKDREQRTAGLSTFGKALTLLVAANLLLGGTVFTLRPPWGGAAEAIAARPQLPSQVQRLAARIAEGHHGEPYTLDLSDEELTAVAGYFLADAPDVPFTRVTIAVSGDKVRADGMTKGLAVTVPVRVTGAVSASDGLPRARVEDVRLGETPLPAFVRDQIVHEANSSLDFSRYPMPVTVDALELRPGGMTIRGTVK